MNETLSSIILTGMNNPECSFFTGAFVGGVWVVKYLLILYGFMILSNAMNRLAFDPLWSWLKKKIYTKRGVKDE